MHCHTKRRPTAVIDALTPGWCRLCIRSKAFRLQSPVNTGRKIPVEVSQRRETLEPCSGILSRDSEVEDNLEANLSASVRSEASVSSVEIEGVDHREPDLGRTRTSRNAKRSERFWRSTRQAKRASSCSPESGPRRNEKAESSWPGVMTSLRRKSE